MLCLCRFELYSRWVPLSELDFKKGIKEKEYTIHVHG